MKRVTKISIIAAILLSAFSCGEKENVDAASKAYLRLDLQEKKVQNSEGSFEVYISSNTTWTIESQSEWIKTSRTSGKGNLSVRINYEANESGKRTGALLFKADGTKPVQFLITQSSLLFSNPIFQMPDPYIVKDGDTYWTCKAQGNGINISRSNKLSVVNGTRQIWATPYDSGSNKVWNRANVWAPELFHIGDRWYIYYAAGRPTSETNGSYNTQRTGVLRSKTDDPSGAWEDMGMIYTGDNYTKGIVPTVDNTGYAIDMTVFELKGKLYAVWSGYPPGSGNQWLYIASMENPYTINSNRIAISKPDQSWELANSKINEGPAVLINEKAGKIFVVYSCNGSWTKHYRLGWIMLDMDKDPLVASNWTKSPQQAFYRCDNTAEGVNGVNGVGHCTFTKSPDDTEDWIVYHVKRYGTDGWDERYAFIQKFTWNADGTPNFGTPAGWGEELDLPSGESM